MKLLKTLKGLGAATIKCGNFIFIRVFSKMSYFISYVFVGLGFVFPYPVGYACTQIWNEECVVRMSGSKQALKHAIF